MSGADEEKETFIGDDSLPSSPTTSRVMDIASPSQARFTYAHTDLPTTSLPHSLAAHDEAEEDKAEAVTSHPAPPYTVASSADLSRQAEVVAVPTGPAQALQSAIAAASSPPPSASDASSSDPLHSSSHLSSSARTASIKAVNPAANVKQSAPRGGQCRFPRRRPRRHPLPRRLRPATWRCSRPTGPTRPPSTSPSITCPTTSPSPPTRPPSPPWTRPSSTSSKPSPSNAPPPVDLAVFDDCTGTVPHGQMTLVLAPPGAGKSQFLKALAGRLRKDKRVSGDLWYNGLTADEQLHAGAYVEKLCALVAQGDVHMANLTVRETLKFALDSSVADPALLHPADPRLVAWHRKEGGSAAERAGHARVRGTPSRATPSSAASAEGRRSA